MRNTLLATAGLAIGLLACADGRTPTHLVDADAAFEVAASPPIFQDGFESGALLLWDDGASPAHHRVVTDSTLAHSGSRVLEVSYPAGDEGSWLTKFFYPGYQSVHLSYWIRFPESWTGGGHLLGIYGSHVDNKWSAHGTAGVCPTGWDFFSTFLTAADDGDPGAVRLSTYHPGMPRTGTQCWGDEGAVTVYQGDGLLTRGAWHRIEFFVQANTPGQADGVQRVWIDGNLRAEWTGLRFRETTDLTINSIQLATYSPTPAPEARTLYIDDVVVRQSGGANAIAIASIEVNPASLNLGVGRTTQLTATARDAAGRPIPGVNFSWSSSDWSTASVSSSGLVKALKRGSAVITARAGGRVGRARVRVQSAAAVASVAIAPASGSVAVGQTLQFVATAKDAAGNPLTGVPILWSSSHAQYATVDTAGRAAGLAVGVTNVTATSGASSATATLSVTGASPAPSPPSPAPVASVAVTPATANVEVGQSTQFTATLRDSAGTTLVGRTVVWHSSSPEFATVDAAGRTTGVAPGTATIVATSEGKSANASLTVGAPPPPPSPVVQQIILTPASATLATGATQQFTATAQMSDGTQQPAAVTYAATGGTITGAGSYTAGTSGGSYRVIATQQGGTLADTATVTITAPAPPPPSVVVTRLDVTPATVTVSVGATRQFAATEVLSDGSSRAATGVTWTATGGTISAGGLYLAGSSAGSFRVIGTKGAFADTAAVTIPLPVVVTQIVVTPASATLATGATQQFTATAQMSNGTQQPATVTWAATGGTISGAGFYTAGNSGGSYRVIATQQGGILADTAAITLTAPPPPPPPCSGTCSLDWFEDFRSGTFTAKGLVQEASNANAVMVSASGLGFPSGTVNVARNVHAGDLDVQWVANARWRAPAVGEYVFLRMYIRNSLPNGANTGADHGNQSNVGDVKWAWLIEAGSGGTYNLDVANSAQSNIRLASGISKGSVQRLEWRLSRTSSTSGVVTFRVYSSTGTLLGEGTRNMSGMTDALYRTARWGISGQAGASYFGNGIEWGNLAARVSGNSNDWIGAYPVAGAEQ